MLAVAAFFFVLAWGAGALEQSKALRIGTEGDYFPFNYVDSGGRLQGFDIDIANALCEQMQRSCEFVTMDWQGLIPALIAGKFDAIVASLSITEQRRQLVDFTDKYYTTPARFVAANDAELVLTPQGLTDTVLGAQRSTIHAEYLLAHYRDVATVRIYDTQEDMYLDLYNGRLDAALADSLVLLEWLEGRGQGFRFVGEPLTDPEWFGEGVGIAVRKGETELRERLNAALQKILANGTYARINAEYFPFSIY